MSCSKETKAYSFAEIIRLIKGGDLDSANDKYNKLRRLIDGTETKVEQELLIAINKAANPQVDAIFIAKPKISIITVVYNDKRGLERTIKNVIGLSYKEIEFIVIDGASTDGTKDIIRDYNKYISISVSEKDNGIYDAMNKGVNFSNSDYCIFMNAGDEFSAPDILENIFVSPQLNANVIYGDRHYIRPSGTSRLDKAQEKDYIRKGMAFCHQAVFVKTHLMKSYLFNLNYRYAADYDLFCRLYINGESFSYVEIPICRFYAGGASESGLLPYIEVLNIQRQHFGKSGLKESKYLAAFKDNAMKILGDFYEE